MVQSLQFIIMKLLCVLCAAVLLGGAAAESKCGQEHRAKDYCELKACSEEEASAEGAGATCRCQLTKGAFWCQDKNCEFYSPKTYADRKKEECVDGKVPAGGDDDDDGFANEGDCLPKHCHDDDDGKVWEELESEKAEGLEEGHTLEACAAACLDNKDATGFQWNGVKAEKNEGEWCGCLRFKGGMSFKDAIAKSEGKGLHNKGDDVWCTLCPFGGAEKGPATGAKKGPAKGADVEKDANKQSGAAGRRDLSILLTTSALAAVMAAAM